MSLMRSSYTRWGVFFLGFSGYFMCLPGAGFQKSEFLRVIGLVNFWQEPDPGDFCSLMVVGKQRASASRQRERSRSRKQFRAPIGTNSDRQLLPA